MTTLNDILKLADEAGATRFILAPSFGTVLTLQDSTPQPNRFSWDGYVVGLFGQVASGTAADYAGTTLRVQIGGVEDLFVDGQGGPAFLGFLGLFGGVPNFQRIVRRVQRGDLWTLTTHNNTAGSVVPSVWMTMVTDDDIAVLAKAVAKFR